MTTPQPGVLFTGNYRNRYGNPGVPGAPSVLDELAFPPASAVSAEDAGVAEQQALGVVDDVAYDRARKPLQHHVDRMKDFYDGAGVVGVDNDDNLP